MFWQSNCSVWWMLRWRPETNVWMMIGKRVKDAWPVDRSEATVSLVKMSIASILRNIQTCFVWKSQPNKFHVKPCFSVTKKMALSGHFVFAPLVAPVSGMECTCTPCGNHCLLRFAMRIVRHRVACMSWKCNSTKLCCKDTNLPWAILLGERHMPPSLSLSISFQVYPRPCEQMIVWCHVPCSAQL